MIKIGEAAVLLGLTDSEKDKGNARVVLNHFGVYSTEETVPEGKFGKGAKLYARNQVEAIAAFKLPNPAY